MKLLSTRIKNFRLVEHTMKKFYEIMSFDSLAAESYGKVRADLEKFHVSYFRKIFDLLGKKYYN